jgi:ring-1,2-phenylacetyl-CoA epoxidase subunit PaaB
LKPTIENISGGPSLDPRVNRLPNITGGERQIVSSDQLISFEVFVQPRQEKPFQHEGAVRASDLEMAFVLAKETFTRRFSCIALWVVETQHISVSDLKDGDENIYDTYEPVTPDEMGPWFEAFEMAKRGKQHVHIGRVQAGSAKDAHSLARQLVKPGAKACNLWVIPVSKIRYTSETERIMWDTLPEKKFRDATEYKGGDKLKAFLERNDNVNQTHEREGS